MWPATASSVSSGCAAHRAWWHSGQQSCCDRRLQQHQQRLCGTVIRYSRSRHHGSCIRDRLSIRTGSLPRFRALPARMVVFSWWIPTIRCRAVFPMPSSWPRKWNKLGHSLSGVRLDSGDLAYLSRKARAMLNEAGLEYVKIVASNQLDEHVIKSLLEQQAPIDVFGVGTSLVTGASRWRTGWRIQTR